jgi:hypothetical protein
MRRVRTLALATLASGLGFAALAQTPVQPPRDPNMPAQRDTIPEKVAPSDPTTTGSTGSGANLSEKLNQSDGVIRPRTGIDPEMAVPTPNPNAGSMPVIPPPGSLGGNQTIDPK